MSTQNKCFSIVIAAFCAMVLSANAAENQDLWNQSLDELLKVEISVSSTVAQDIFHTPSSVYVIDREAISRYHYQSIAEAVDEVPGMEVMRTYLKRGIPTARGILQDQYANKVLVLINGVPVWNGTTGEPWLERVDIRQVDRIEVLRGPASVIYGTNAYTGTINIVIGQQRDEKGSAFIYSGTRGNSGVGGGTQYENKGFRVFGYANSSDDLGYKQPFIDESKVKGEYPEYIRGSNFTMGMSYGPHSLLYNGFTAHQSYIGVTPSYSAGIGNDQFSRGYMVQYKFAGQIRKNLDGSISSIYDWQNWNYSRTLDDQTRSDLVTYRNSANGRLGYTFSDRIRFDLGADYEIRKTVKFRNAIKKTDSTAADNNMKGRNVEEVSGFGQASYTLQKFSLLAGSRYTHNQLFGDNISSRVTFVYAFTNRNSVKLIAGQSFRAPSLFELYYIPSPATVYGNPDLKPETSTDVELAYLSSNGPLFYQVLGYFANYDKKIYRTKRLPDVPTDASTIYTNSDLFSAKGIELELKYYRPKSTNAFINYCWTEGDNGDQIGTSAYNFKFIPKHQGTIGVSQPFGNFMFSSTVRVWGARGAPLESIDLQYVLSSGLTFTQQVGSTTINHSVTGKNLLNNVTLEPEYARGKLNTVPLGNGRTILYQLAVTL